MLRGDLCSVVSVICKQIRVYVCSVYTRSCLWCVLMFVALCWVLRCLVLRVALRHDGPSHFCLVSYVCMFVVCIYMCMFEVCFDFCYVLLRVLICCVTS